MTKINTALILKSFLEYSRDCLARPTKDSKGNLVRSSQHTQALENYSSLYWAVMVKDGLKEEVAELLADKLYSPKTSAKERELLDNLLGYMTCTVDDCMELYQAVCKVANVVSAFDSEFDGNIEWEYCHVPYLTSNILRLRSLLKLM